MTTRSDSWGNYPKVTQNKTILGWRSDSLPIGTTTILPYGLGRSYGDVCLNDGGQVVSSETLTHLIAFDRNKGTITCEAGLSLAAMLEIIVPYGWFLPVSPGTKFVTVGGAIANDVHGKNHHVAGTFGAHITELWVKRSDGSEIYCTPYQNQELLNATIAGLGLTGFITKATIQLKKVPSAFIDLETIPLHNLDEFFSVSRDSDKTFEYTVAWIDCLKPGKGIFFRGNHADITEKAKSKKPFFSVPFYLPSWTLSTPAVKLFNYCYYTKNVQGLKSRRVHYDPFFYPLDSVHHWNRMYGKRGFLQFQCVVPKGDASKSIFEILSVVSKAGKGSFLAVLKEFGAIKSPGLLSFPREGTTLCLDFPVQGDKTLHLMKTLHTIVREAHGAIYPAKDAVMSPEEFSEYFPNQGIFRKYIDPKFSSSFWRRVTCVQS